MMMASEVPTQSCTRMSSETPRIRNISYRIGTMMAPPPTPNRPASSPVSSAADDDRERQHRKLAGRDAEHRKLREEKAGR